MYFRYDSAENFAQPGTSAPTGSGFKYASRSRTHSFGSVRVRNNPPRSRTESWRQKETKGTSQDAGNDLIIFVMSYLYRSTLATPVFS